MQNNEFLFSNDLVSSHAYIDLKEAHEKILEFQD